MTDAIKPCPATMSEGLLRQAQVLSDEGSDCGCEACVVARSSIGQRLATEVLAAHKRIVELEAVLVRACDLGHAISSTVEHVEMFAEIRRTAGKPAEGEGQR